MFLVYFIARAHHPAAFHSGPGQLSLVAGTINTLAMVSSSYCLVRAVHAMRDGRGPLSLRWLLVAFCLGAVYPLVKFLEVRWNVAHGIDGGAGIFFTVYYYLSFNHLVHVCWGLCGLAWVMARTRLGGYTAAEHGGLEALACYWHATDLVWLMIFPLCYVLG